MSIQDSLICEAKSLAENHLACDCPQRWNHVQGVAKKAADIAQQILPGNEASILIAAAWLHDIGYAPLIATTGFHALDGAHFLRKNGFNERTTNLVAHHSLADAEAVQRHMEKELEAFHNEGSILTDALLYADMCTGPMGQPLSVTERLNEIIVRYGKDHPAADAISTWRPHILATVKRIENRLNECHP